MSGRPRSYSAADTHPQRTGQAAFTLVELLVVVTLVGLAAAGVTLSLRGTTEPACLRAATLQIEQTWRLARHRAATRHVPVWVQFQSGGGRYRLVWSEETTGVGPAWKTLDGVTIVRGTVLSSATPREREGLLTLRITPSGASLPWALELSAGQARRVLWTDGATGRVAHHDDWTLDEFLAQSSAGDREP